MEMQETKRKKLGKSGWKVGSVKEFLGLSAAELSSIEKKLALYVHQKGKISGNLHKREK